jgi:hypothetical protein
MINLRRRSEDAAPRRGILDELEWWLRRARVLPLIAPMLLFAGFGLGRMANDALELRDDAQTRRPAEVEVPRIQLEALSHYMESLRRSGEHTADFVVLYQEHVLPVEQSLRRRGVPARTAREVAWPLVEHAYRQSLDPATVLSVLLIESNGRPTATSPVGARGLMQVMPLWAGSWRGCGRNLYDIEDNLCHGTSILAWYLRRNDGDERRALLGYNGCVRGTNTPDCHRYPDKVQRLRQQIQAEWRAGRITAVAASP